MELFRDPLRKWRVEWLCYNFGLCWVVVQIIVHFAFCFVAAVGK